MPRAERTTAHLGHRIWLHDPIQRAAEIDSSQSPRLCRNCNICSVRKLTSPRQGIVGLYQKMLWAASESQLGGELW